MRHFFAVYKQLEGKETAVDEVMSEAKAREIIKQCIENYKREFVKNKENIC
jgi:inorganic pyrophosphatase